MQKYGKVLIAGSGPGDPGLLTVKVWRALQDADIIIYDNLVNRDVLTLARPNAELRYMGKKCGGESFSQEEINAALVEAAGSAQLVLRLKGGDPFIFGRGGEEALVLQKHGIPFEIVPGISSSVAGPAYAGIPVTHRGLSCSYAVITGHEAPEKAESDLHWSSYAGIHTLVFLMGVGQRKEIARKLLEAGRPTHDPVAFVENATTAKQNVIRTTLGVLAETPPPVNTPAVMVIGSVAGLELEWFSGTPSALPSKS